MTEPEPEPEPESKPGPVDLAVPTLEDYEDNANLEAGVSHYGFTRRFGTVLGVVIMLGVVSFVLDVIATFGLDRARSAVYRCPSSVESGDLELCRSSWRPLASLWPMTRHDMLVVRAESNYEIDEQYLIRATHLDFDAEAEAAAIERLIEDSRICAGLGHHCGDELLDDLHRRGAHAAVLEHADTGWLWSQSFSHSALLLGKPDRVLARWANVPIAEIRELDGLRGAGWLCLVDLERGLAALDQVSSTEFAIRMKTPERRHLLGQTIHLARVACGSPDVRAGAAQDDDAQAWLAARAAATGSAMASDWLDRHPSNPHRAPVIAQALQREAPEPSQVLDWLAPGLSKSNVLGFSAELGQAGRGMIVMRRANRAAITYDPATMAAAAQRLAELAELAELGELGELVEPGEPGTLGMGLRPDVLLRHGAAVLADEAALEWIARGQPERALALAHRARAWHTREDEWYAVGLALLAGDHEGTLEWVTAQREALAGELPEPVIHDTPEGRRLTELELRALSGLGRWQDARARAIQSCKGTHAELESVAGHLQLMHTWLVALSHQVGEPAKLDFTTCTYSGDDDVWRGGQLAELDKLLGDPREARTRRERRFNMSISSEYPDLVVSLVAGVAHAPEHEERWLDAALPWEDALGREQLWARAEAARWRGDLEAEQRWRERLARVLALADTEDRALLLHAAGL